MQKMFTFFVISPIYAWKITPFSWFREFAPTFEKLPLSSSRKWVGTSVVYVLVGSGGVDIRAILIKNVGGTAYDNIFRFRSYNLHSSIYQIVYVCDTKISGKYLGMIQYKDAILPL